MQNKNIYLRLLSVIKIYFTKRQKVNFLKNLLLFLISGFIELMGLALVISVIYVIKDDEIIKTNNTLNFLFQNIWFLRTEKDFKIFIVFLLPVVFLMKNGLLILISYVKQLFVNDIAENLTLEKFSNILNKKITYFAKTNSNLTTRDVSTLPSEFAFIVVQNLMILISELIVVIFLLITIVVYNPIVSFIVIFTIIPFAFGFYKITNKKIKTLGDKVVDLRHKVYKDIFETILGVEEVKIYRKESFFKKRPKQGFKKLFKLTTKFSILKEIPARLIELIAVFSISLIFLISSIFNEDGEYVFNTLVLFATLSYRLMPSVNKIITASIEIKNKSYTIDNIINDSDFKKNQPVKKNQPKNVNFKSLKFDNLYFNYEKSKKNILQGFNFSIKSGEKVGVFGESGSGKSTFIKILCGLIKPNNGDIYFNGNKLDYDKFSNLKIRIGYVKQDFFLLDSTVVENIAFGEEKEEFNEHLFLSSVRAAEIENTINTLDLKENTMIGEFGKSLSGGQRQRIAIARALYLNSDILVFDEATSGLDETTEKKVLENIHSYPNNPAIIMVTHRKSTLNFCDKVYEINDGKALETPR